MPFIIPNNTSHAGQPLNYQFVGDGLATEDIYFVFLLADS